MRNTQIGSIVKRGGSRNCELSGVANFRASFLNATNCSSKQSEARRAGRGLHIQRGSKRQTSDFARSLVDSKAGLTIIPNCDTSESGDPRSVPAVNSSIARTRAASRRILILVQSLSSSSLPVPGRRRLPPPRRLGTRVTRC